MKISFPWDVHGDVIDLACGTSVVDCVNSAGAGTVAMTTGSHVMSVAVGDSLQLDCGFEAARFNLFDNPVLWRKTQGSEHTQLNMMGNVLEPFVSERRFQVYFIPKPPHYTLWLHIAGQPITFNTYCCLYRPT